MTFHDESAQARAQVCLTCHEKETERFQFRRSEHKLTGVACNDCHAPHFPAMPAGCRQKTPELCFSCHREVRCLCPPSASQGAGRCPALHRLPYTARQPESFFLRGVHNETCTRCHIEKGGPFAFEHLASRIEGCTSCHVPHGSTNKFLLKRWEERVLCLECHSNAPLFHNQAPGAFSRAPVLGVIRRFTARTSTGSSSARRLTDGPAGRLEGESDAQLCAQVHTAFGLLDSHLALRYAVPGALGERPEGRQATPQPRWVSPLRFDLSRVSLGGYRQWPETAVQRGGELR